MSNLRITFVTNSVLYRIKKIKTCNVEDLKEPLFCSLIVENLVTPFLCLEDGYVQLLGYEVSIIIAILLFLVTFINNIYNRSTDESIGSKERRKSLKGRIPDLSVQVEFDNYSALPFVCEVKSPQFITGLKKSENQHPDFIKLCNIMKDELDRMCFVTNKVVYGLLVEGKTHILVYDLYAKPSSFLYKGYKCRLFAMDLKYYKLYRLYMISQFYLPRDKYDLGVIVSCFSRLENLHVCIIILV